MFNYNLLTITEAGTAQRRKSEMACLSVDIKIEVEDVLSPPVTAKKQASHLRPS